MKKIVRKIFFVWGEDKEKKFLEDMALKGYKLVGLKFGKYIFEKDTPRKLVYEFDFRGLDKTSEEEYTQIFEDSGWNLMANYGGWYYFARECDKEEVDYSIFNNNESKRAKYKRLMLFLLVIGFPLYYQTIIFFPNMPEAKLEFPKFNFFIRIIATVFMGLHMFAFIKVANIYRKLKSHIKE